MKKFLAVLLAVIMAFTALTAVVYAADDGTGNDNGTVQTDGDTDTTEEEEESKSLFGIINLSDIFDFSEYKSIFGNNEDGSIDFSNFGTTILFIGALPLISFLHGILIIVFLVLGVMELTLADLGISL